MSSITVERTGFGIVVAAEGDAETESLLDGLPPLRAARYLVATAALQQSLRDAAPEVVDAVRPHLDGTVVVPAEGFAGEGADGAEAGSARLARVLGVPVVAPEGRFLPCPGTLFSVGRGDGWITRSPQGARVPTGRRYPAPRWQQHLPPNLPGTAHIPAGLWMTAGAEARHAVRLAGIAVREEHLLIVVGSPAEPAPSRERLEAVLRALPAEVRSAVVLVGYGPGSLGLATVRDLAATLEQPFRIAHGVEIDGRVVRLDGDETTPPPTLAIESVCAPDGSVRLERWEMPPGLVAAPAGGYRFDEKARARRRASADWQVQIIPTGLMVAPVGERLVEPGAAASAGDALSVYLQCDGARRPTGLPRLLDPLLARLERLGTVAIHPLDATARRVVRDAYPGRWAPTEALALTPDGRLIAATMDASGDTPAADAAVPIDEKVVGHTDPVTAPSERPGHPIEGPDHPDAADDTVSPMARERRSSQGPVTVGAVVGVEDETRLSRESALGRRARGALAAAALDGENADANRSTAAPSAPAAGALSVSDVGSAAQESSSTAPTAAASLAPTAGAAAEPSRSSSVTGTPSAAPAPASAAVAPAPSTAAPAATPAVAVPGAPPAGGPPRAGLTRALQGSTLTPAPGPASRTGSIPVEQRQTAPHDPVARVSPSAAVPTATASPDSTTTAPAQKNAPVRPAAPERATATEPASPSAPAPEESSAGSVEAASSPASAVSERPPVTSVEPSALAHSRRLREVPVGVRSTAEQRHGVRTALGPRYDIASRTVSHLLAQQPGMRASTGDRSAMLTGLSLVRIFAAEPHAEYDLDFHICLAEGLAMLPTARTVVVRGIPSAVGAEPGDVLRLRMPLVAAAADGPPTGPAEALIWTTSGRRLDRVLHGVTGAEDVALPAGIRLRVLEGVGGPAARMLLAEEGTGTEQALARLRSAAEARGDLRAHADDRWLGDLPSAA